MCTEENVKKFCIRHEKRTNLPVRHMSFHHNNLGDRLTFAEGDSIQVMKFQENAVVYRCVNYEKGGVGIVKYLENKQHIAHTTYKNRTFRIRLLNIDTSYRGFQGHTDEIISLSVGFPANPNYLLSTGKDKRLFLWNTTADQYIHKILIKSPAIAAFHPSGTIFAVAYDSKFIEIYDVRNMKASVAAYSFPVIENVKWKELKYSRDGNFLLVTTNSAYVIVIDATEGQLFSTFRDYVNANHENISASFDYDTKFVFGGSSDGFLNVWSMETKTKICRYRLNKKGENILNVEFNPELMMFATSGNSGVKIWTMKDECFDNY